MSTQTASLPEQDENAATIQVGSDRYPYTIIRRTDTKVWVQQDRTTGVEGHSNSYTESQRYLYYANPDAPVIEYSLRKNGRFYKVGEEMGYGALHIGRRNYYQDPSF